jgi:SAM-dependent methyltransferase
MLQWYRSLVSKYGFAAASRYYTVSRWRGVRFRVLNKLRAPRVACPCCGWKGYTFEDYIEIDAIQRGVECPSCGSHSRHRMLFLWLQRSEPFDQKEGTALLFAPERRLGDLLASSSRMRWVRLDFEPARGVNLLADIQRLPLADESADLIWCHHVLEHVPDDHAAIGELSRVLRSAAGEMIVSVPMGAGAKTDEYGYCDERRSGHWRLYGDDFTERLSAGGLRVEQINFDFSPDEARKYGLAGDRIYRCRKSSTRDRV